MKQLLLICLICSFLAFYGCSFKGEINSQDTSSESGVNKNEQVENEFLIEDTEKNLISIKLPIIDENSEKNLLLIKDFIQSKISEFSGETFHLTWSKNDVSKENINFSKYTYYIDLDTEISYASENLVSVIFKGFFNTNTAAHPTNLFYTFNFNPKTSQEIAFSDLYIVDEALYEAFSQQASKDLLEKFGGEWPSGWKSFSEELCSKEDFFEGLDNGSVYYYHTENGVGFSYPVIYALGNHIETELPLDIIKKK